MSQTTTQVDSMLHEQDSSTVMMERIQQAFIYVRSLRADDLQLQAALLKENATELGLECNRVFYDSCSGMEDPLRRPGLSKLMTALKATPTVSQVVVVDQSRIGRSRTHMSSVNRHLKNLGVELLFVQA